MPRLTKKTLVLGAATVCVLAIAAGAYAYFSSTGSGTVTATVGTSSAVTIKGTVSGALYPGSSSTVNFTVDNPSSGKQRVGAISLTEVKVDAAHSACVTSEVFTMPVVAVNAQFGPGNGQAVTPTGTLSMKETGSNQDNCQGATLTLVLASN